MNLLQVEVAETNGFLKQFSTMSLLVEEILLVILSLLIISTCILLQLKNLGSRKPKILFSTLKIKLTPRLFSVGLSKRRI